ncbi:MAG: FAD-dependent monooxygenase [Planktomarina sp.]
MARHAIIIGGGIGGACAALALEDIGWRTTILEQAEALTEVGAGIQISPNGCKILSALGVLQDLECHAFEAPAITLKIGTSGRQIFSMPMGQAARARWGAPHLTVHRADLLRVLLDQVQGQICTGKTVSVATPEGKVRCADGSTHHGDAVIAADGLHSLTRQMHFEPYAPRYTGNMAWRALVDGSRIKGIDRQTTIWAGPGRHAITNWIRGGQVLNFVGVVEKSMPNAAEDWNAQGHKSQALEDFASFVPELRGVIEAADTLNLWPLYDRAPLTRWTHGRIALLGDAAHAMLPSMAQGAVQAMEDAWMLAYHLHHTDDIPAALDAYAKARIPRATAVQKQSSRNLTQFHVSGKVRQALTYGPMLAAHKMAPKVLYSRPDWIYRWAPPMMKGEA